MSLMAMNKRHVLSVLISKVRSIKKMISTLFRRRSSSTSHAASSHVIML